MHPQALTPAGTNPKTVGGHAFAGLLIGGGIGFAGTVALLVSSESDVSMGIFVLPPIGFAAGAVLGSAVGLGVGLARR
jgi:hypothetical protein